MGESGELGDTIGQEDDLNGAETQEMNATAGAGLNVRCALSSRSHSVQHTQSTKVNKVLSLHDFCTDVVSQAARSRGGDDGLGITSELQNLSATTSSPVRQRKEKKVDIMVS